MTRPFVNWSRTVRSQPTAWLRPRDTAEVAAILARAHADGRRVRVVGSGHSWSAVAAPDDLAMELYDLDRFVAVDPVAGTVTVQAGMRLQTLVDTLAHLGLALPNVGSVLAQRIAGAVATGTHGSSRRPLEQGGGNLAAGVRALTLVTGTGEVVSLSGDDPRLDAARVHLGALGVVTELTLAVVPAFKLRETKVRLPFAEAADTVVARVDTADFGKLWWLPHTDEALLVTYERTDAPGQRDPWAWAVDDVVNRTLFRALLAVEGKVPSLVPAINRLVDRVHFTEGTRVGRSDELLTLVMPPRHRETELALPVAHTAEALHAVRALIDRLGARLDFIVETRFVAADPGWLSPAYGRDSVHLGVYGAWSPDVDAVFAGFREAGRAWDARPHWGKETDVTWDDVRSAWPRAADFRALAETLDPGGVLVNPFVRQVLGR